MPYLIAQADAAIDAAGAAKSLFEDSVLVGVIISLFGFLLFLVWIGLKAFNRKEEIHDNRLEVMHSEHKTERAEWKQKADEQSHRNELLLQETIRHLKEK